LILFENKDLIGVDIGASAIKMVQLKKIKKKGFKDYELFKMAYTKLPPEVIKEEEILKPEIVAETIRNIFQENKIEIKNVATSISGKSVIVKKIRLPKMIEEDLEDSIQWEAEQFIPFDINDVSIDFQIISDMNSPDNEMDVLLVAVKKERISDIVSIMELAGLKTAVIDIDVFALENMFEINYSIDPESYFALIDLGAETMCLNILKGNVSSFTRDTSIGINQFNRTIQRELLLDYDQTEALIHGVDIEGKKKEDILPFRDGFLEELLAEIQRSFDYFKATTDNTDINKIYLSGGGAKMDGLLEFLKERFYKDVEILNPFENIFVDSKKFDTDFLSSVDTMLNISVGLALRRIGDR